MKLSGGVPKIQTIRLLPGERVTWRGGKPLLLGDSESALVRARKARDELINMRDLVKHGTPLPQENWNSATVADAYRWYMERGEAEGLKYRTIRDYQTWWKQRVEAQWGWMPLRAVTFDAVQKWIATLREKLAPATIRNFRGLLGNVLQFAMDIGRLPISSNPVRAAASRRGGHRKKAGRERSRVRYWFEPDDLRSLAQVCCADREEGKFWVTLFCVCGITGLRFGEAILLRWENFDWRRSNFIPEVEKASSTEMAVTEELGELLCLYAGNRQPKRGYIFQEEYLSRLEEVRRRKGVTRREIEIAELKAVDGLRHRGLRKLKSYSALAGIPGADKLGFHAFRRTYAQLTHEVTDDAEVCKELTRHVEDRTHGLYLKKLSKKAREAASGTARKFCESFQVVFRPPSQVVAPTGPLLLPEGASSSPERTGTHRKEPESGSGKQSRTGFLPMKVSRAIRQGT